jgi:hypothetical protein
LVPEVKRIADNREQIAGGEEEKEEFSQSSRRKSTEDTEKREERNVRVSDRKNPPFANGAKDGAPSSIFVGRPYLEDQLGDSLWPVVVS